MVPPRHKFNNLISITYVKDSQFTVAIDRNKLQPKLANLFTLDPGRILQNPA